MTATAEEATVSWGLMCMLQGPDSEAARGEHDLGLVSGWESESGFLDLKTLQVTPPPFMKPGFLPIKNPK